MSWIWAERIDNGCAWLGPDEFRHASKVLRKRAGQAVQLLDGAGRVGVGAWNGTPEIELDSVSQQASTGIWLAFGIGSRSSNEESIRRAAELGAQRIIPVIAARSRDAGKPERWDAERMIRIARSGCAQSGNAWLPTVDDPVPMTTLTEICSERRPTMLAPDAAVALAANVDADTLVVGPEGGWQDDEMDLFPTAKLGPFVMRTPVAVAAGLAVMLQLRS